MPKLGEYKIHTCCICHRVLTKKPHRLVHQEWSTIKGQYQNTHNFDYCDECFNTFKRWIVKHNRREEEEE